MTKNEEKLINAGQALRVSLGHNLHCPKASHAVPCNCGAKDQQAPALVAWDRLVDEIEESSVS
jgi:hypothetical protein